MFKNKRNIAYYPLVYCQYKVTYLSSHCSNKSPADFRFSLAVIVSTDEWWTNPGKYSLL